MNGVIEIRAPGAPPARRNLPRNPVVLGRAPRSGIAVPSARELADEHLIVSLARTGCHLALLPGVDLEPTLHGKPFQQCDVVWGDEVVLGRTSLRFLGNRPASGPRPIVVVGVLLLAALIGWALFATDPSRAGISPPPSAPLLFGGQTPCPATARETLPYADELEQTAIGRAERYNFAAIDGIRAVNLFALAVSCYELGGDRANAARVARSFERWKTRIENRYQIHQLQLRLALDRKDKERAALEREELLLLLNGRTGPYIEWLIALARQLESLR